jgi:hypothetical protein
VQRGQERAGQTRSMDRLQIDWLKLIWLASTINKRIQIALSAERSFLTSLLIITKLRLIRDHRQMSREQQ